MEQKKLLLSIMVVGMISSAALAVAPIGPPVAGLAEGQYAVGISYTRADLEVEISGPFVGARVGHKAVQNAESTGYYAHLGYGISDTWCAQVTLGMANLDADADRTWAGPQGKDFHGDHKFTFGVGTKKTLHDNGNGTKWGTAFQYLRGRSSDRITQPTSFGNGAISVSLPVNIDVDWYLMQLAMGPSFQVNEDLCFYGGPFLMFLEADVTIKNAPIELEIEQAFELGVFIGTMINLGGAAGLNLEFLYTSESWGAGIGAMFPL